ncbi:MAG: EAL domain-containing protein [Proteobacteria bacterium]|nr:EAL domain-containing protein [Pseudomonadota bacterium]
MSESPISEVGSRSPIPGPAHRPPLRSYAEEIGRISQLLRENGALCVILVDASPLERIERTYGVEAYWRAIQELLQLVTEACREELGSDDIIASSDAGVDEIAIFVFRPREDDGFYRESLPALARALTETLARNGNRIVYPYHREAPFLPVGCGLALHNPGLREERQVREALERARSDAEINARIQTRNRSKRFVDLVLAEDVTMLYEPIVNLTTREILGYEALVRGPWDSELHSPGALFQMAHETGLVFELDCLCRRAALRGARGLPPGKLLFLNCLPTAIHDPGFRGDELRRTLESLRLRPSDVVFEISEKESIDNFTIFREARDYYADLGFKIALDDTGVAYGSLEAVMELSPDFIKVDLSLVRSIDTDPPRQELLRALHSVACKLKAEIIAEGIETSEELATIQSLGIPYGQGYLFGRAAPLRRAV